MRILTSKAHCFNLCAVDKLLDGTDVFCVELEQNGHLEGGGLWGHQKHIVTVPADS